MSEWDLNISWMRKAFQKAYAGKCVVEAVEGVFVRNVKLTSLTSNFQQLWSAQKVCEVAN